MSKSLFNTLLWVTIYAIAMAFLESAVVVYLRELYYPTHELFPLNLIDGHIAFTELLRELATLVMMVAIGFLASDNGKGRFAWFIYTFAIWDIFYYLSLKFLINWPSTLMEWDVLFLIPFTWIGPVIAPIINSITMISLAMVIHHFINKKATVKIGLYPWILLFAGSFIVIGAYAEDYVQFMSQQFSIFGLLNPANGDAIIELAARYIPHDFAWWTFSAGVLMHLAAIGLVIRSNTK
jgi:hypothetical protein